MSEFLDELFNSNNVAAEDIKKLIDQNEKESLSLEYKSGAWLQNNKTGKFNLSKWVSSFANSAGGTLIIGVSEKEADNDEKFPDQIDGIDSTVFGEDIGKWIEDVIVSRIYPKLNPIPRIIPINIENSQKLIVVIQIEPTNYLIHSIIKNGEHLYFHRHNFQVLQMDEWEIRTLVYGRTPPPILEINIENIHGNSLSDEGICMEYTIKIKIENVGWRIAKYLQFGIIRPTVDFSSNLETNFINNPTIKRKNHLLNNFGKFFDVECQEKSIIDIFTFSESDFLQPYDSIELSYRIQNWKLSIFDEIQFGLYILAENLIKPQTYGLKVMNLGSDEKPKPYIYQYGGQKVKIFAHPDNR